MQNFSQIGEVPWPRHFDITRILQSTTLKRVRIMARLVLERLQYSSNHWQ